jgi:hypothetical protein
MSFLRTISLSVFFASVFPTVSACKRPKPIRSEDMRDAGQPTAPVHEPPPGYEAKLEGKLLGDVDAAKHVVLLTSEPCTPKNLTTVPATAIGHAESISGEVRFALEAVYHAGSIRYLCAFGLGNDNRTISSFGLYGQNPLRLQAPEAGDEIELEHLQLTLHPVLPPVRLPSARF